MSSLTGSLQPTPKVVLTGTLTGAAPPAPVPEAVPVPESPQEPSVPVDGGETLGLTRVQDDPAPTLGGNLRLNTFRILGTLEGDALTLDGGLLD